MKNFVNVDTRFQKINQSYFRYRGYGISKPLYPDTFLRIHFKTVSDKYCAGTGRTCNNTDWSLWKRKIASFAGVAGITV